MKEEETFHRFYICNQHLLHKSIAKDSCIHTSQVWTSNSLSSSEWTSCILDKLLSSDSNSLSDVWAQINEEKMFSELKPKPNYDSY